MDGVYGYGYFKGSGNFWIWLVLDANIEHLKQIKLYQKWTVF